MSKLLLIDGTALVFRGFYGIRHLAPLDDQPINAIYGFYSILLNLLLNERPSHFVVCFDRSETTSRKIEYPEYKANRKKTPDDLFSQIPIIKSILVEGALNLSEKAGVEADDIIATLAKHHENTPNVSPLVYSSDLDLIQLVNEQTNILKPVSSKDDRFIYNLKTVHDKYGLVPSQIPDYKGLHGDPSDNLPGVKGVGVKTATKLIQEYGSLEGIYENLDKIKGSLKTKLENDKEMAFFCKKLATLQTDIDTPRDLANFHLHNINFQAIEENFKQLQFNNLQKKLHQLRDYVTTQKQQDQQATLF